MYIYTDTHEYVHECQCIYTHVFISRYCTRVYECLRTPITIYNYDRTRTHKITHKILRLSVGFRLTYFRQIDSYPTTLTLSAATFSQTLNTLSTGSMYVVTVLAYTSVGDGPQTSDTATTWGGYDRHGRLRSSSAHVQVSRM